MIPWQLRTDVLRAATRVAVIVPTLMAAPAAIEGKIDVRLLVGCFCLALVTVPMTLIERHRARHPPKNRGGALILLWCAGFLSLLMLFAQLLYWDTGGLEGMGTAYGKAQDLLQPEALASFAFFGTLLTVASATRVPEQDSPISSSVQWTGVIGLLLIPFGGCGAMFLAMVIVGALSAAYSAGDWVAARVLGMAHTEDARTLRHLRLPRSRLRLLARLGHRPAQALLGAEIVEPEADLRRWFRSLGIAGTEARRRAGLALVRAAVPHWEDAHPGLGLAREALDALDACAKLPTEDARTAAQAAAARWRDGSWQAQVAFEAAYAITSGPAVYSEVPVADALWRAATVLEKELGAGAARGAVEAELIPWALETDAEARPRVGDPEESTAGDPAQSEPDESTATCPGTDSATDPAPPTP